jgi:hypothetical protein
MPSPPNITNIPAPRVPLIDERTGLMSREWYRFFFNLFNLTGGGSNAISLQDLQVGPPTGSEEQVVLGRQIDGALAAPDGSTQESQIAELQKQVETLQVQPLFDVSTIDAAINAKYPPPAIKIADFSVVANETWLINNKSSSSCVVTLPPPAAIIGRVLQFQNYQAQTLVSASSNVVPLAGGAATTTILQAVAGANATLVSDGANWVMTKYDSNNSLELE